MRQLIELCILPILVSVAVAHSSESSDNSSGSKDSNNSNKNNICKPAQNFIEKYKSLDPPKATCQCGEISSVQVFNQSRKKSITYKRCTRCSDNRPAVVDNGFCNNNGNNNRFKNDVCSAKDTPCVGDLKVSVCCQGNTVPNPTQAPTQPPTATQAPTEPPTTTQAATTTTVCVPDPDGFGCNDDGDLRK